MVSLLIRNVDPALHAELKSRAARHRHSVQDEARLLLKAALAASPEAPSLVALAASLFGPENGVDLDIPDRNDDIARPIPDFSA